ncbi:hypothetical protein J0H58_21990 [bacterium]|nr:hypothetical protein [bacterium]
MPARVGCIQLKGFAKKDEEKVSQAVGVRSGQIIRYPECEAARERVEKLGYKGVEVVELPNEMASEFKDILVRCAPAAESR